MIKSALVAFTTFFATVGPANLAALFAALTHDNTPRERKAMATQVQRILGVTGLQVLTRIVGILLGALAVQFVFDGVAKSGLVG